MKTKLNKKGQASLEILIIMGVLILVGIIFMLIFLSSLKKNSNNKEVEIAQNKMFSDFDSNLNEYEIPIQPEVNISFSDLFVGFLILFFNPILISSAFFKVNQKVI